MWKRLKLAAAGSMIAALAVTTACSGFNAAPFSSKAIRGEASSPPVIGSVSQTGQGQKMPGAQDAAIPLKQIGNVNYVSAGDLVGILNFQSDWVEGKDTFLIGDHDSNFELSMNSTKARKDGYELNVHQPFVKQGVIAYIPISALGDLFQEDMSYKVSEGQLRIHPSPAIEARNEDDLDPGGTEDELDFADDPNDPFKDADEAANPVSGTGGFPMAEIEAWSPVGRGDIVPVLKNTDINALIRKGKQYMGVKYKFGADSYPSAGLFDCSAFTQYIYGKFGVKLPRLARQQAAEGNLVSRKSLRKGDLLFFYVPGRFKSNKNVGHVGMYIGNHRMLHASPLSDKGVQITNIDTAYWKETFLRAKRVI